MIKKFVKGKINKFKTDYAYDKAAKAEIKKKEQQAYYKALEQERVKAAKMRAKHKVNPPKSKGKGGGDILGALVGDPMPRKKKKKGFDTGWI